MRTKIELQNLIEKELATKSNADKIAFISEKAKLEDVEHDILVCMPDEVIDVYYDVVRYRNSGWVHEYVTYTLQMALYPDYSFYLAQNWPGGNGSKVALNEMLTGLRNVGFLKSKKIRKDWSGKGRMSLRELVWIEVEMNETLSFIKEALSIDILELNKNKSIKNIFTFYDFEK